MGEAKRRAAIPPLKEWLDQFAPGAPSKERDDFSEFVKWTEALLAVEHTSIPHHARCLRLLKVMSVAIVEASNYEFQRDRDVRAISVDLVRQMGIAFGYAFMSLDWKDETPHRSFVRPLAELFASGMKFSIDECLRLAERQEKASG